MIKIKATAEATIILTCIAAEPLDEAAEEALSIAETEIVADFPEHQIRREMVISGEPLPKEDILAEGWVYQRAE